MRSGMTLVELLVVLVILGVLSGVAVGAISSLKTPQGQIRSSPSARVSAIRSGAAISTWDSAGRLLLYLPDGRVLAPGIDPLTGTAHARR